MVCPLTVGMCFEKRVVKQCDHYALCHLLILQSFVEMEEGWHCGITGRATTCDTVILNGCMMESQLLHFESGSVLNAWEDSKVIQILGPLHPRWEILGKFWASGFQLSNSYCWDHLGSELIEDFFLFLSSLLNKQTKQEPSGQKSIPTKNIFKR